MRVLVTVSSKHGGTEGIGKALAEQLRAAGLQVDYVPAGAGPLIRKYDAFIIGSAIYMGRWMGDVRDLITDGTDTLRGHPVWLFSSGPITDKVDPADSAEGERLLDLVEGREHRLFAGRLERSELGLGERAIVRMVHSPWGDYRPWADIRAWADEIAKELTAVPA